MKNFNLNVLSVSDSLTSNGSQIDAGQLISASFHAYFGDTTAGGTFKLQASNDICAFGNVASNFTVTNWVDIPVQTATISSGGSAILTIAQNVYRWLRPVYTNTATGIQTVTTLREGSAVANKSTVACVADVGVKQVQTVTTVADVAGSLNSTYFLISSINLTSKVAKNFYVWLSNGTGVDPAVAGRTAVPVVYTNDDTATTLGGLIRTALAALTNDFTITGATTGVIATNKAAGVATVSSDGTAATGFTFANTLAGVATNLNSKYFTLSNVNNTINYYVWYNVDTIGTDPALAGKTGIAVALTSGSSATTVGSTSATPIAAVHSAADFTASSTTGTITITNVATGPCTATAQGAASTGFTIATTVVGQNVTTPLLAGKYFLLNSANAGTGYYVWYKVGGSGTDPAVSGRTGVEVDIVAGEALNSVGSITATAVDALTEFAASSNSGVVTVTNSASGPFTPATDFDTTFTIARTAGGTTTININMNALSV